MYLCAWLHDLQLKTRVYSNSISMSQTVFSEEQRSISIITKDTLTLTRSGSDGVEGNEGDGVSVMKIFRRSGTGGHQKSTTANNKYGEAYFDQFLRLKGKTYCVATSDSHEEEICQLSLVQEFGTFLSENAKKTSKGKVCICSFLLLMFLLGLFELYRSHVLRGKITTGCCLVCEQNC